MLGKLVEGIYGTVQYPHTIPGKDADLALPVRY